MGVVSCHVLFFKVHAVDEVCLLANHEVLDHRDVAAGIAILQEAGGLVTTANPPEYYETAAIPDVRLGSRLYLAIR